MVEIVPAIMPGSFEELARRAGEVAGAERFVQVDVMDGALTSAANWPYRMGESERLPAIPGLSFELDLMVREPSEKARTWVAAGAARVVLHSESAADIPKELRKLRGEFPQVEWGVALPPAADSAPFLDIPAFADFVQCMGIARIGFQGEPFDKRVLVQVAALRKAFPALIISVDGGVSEETAPRLAAAGANRLVVGSAIFGKNSSKIFHAPFG